MSSLPEHEQTMCERWRSDFAGDTSLNDLAPSHRLADALKRYEAWSAPRTRYIEQNEPRLSRGECTWDQFSSGLTDIGTKMLSDHDSCTEIDSIVKELCAAYLVGIPGQRAQIQNLVAEQWALGMRVQALPEKMTAEIVSLQDVTKLRYALAAMSIERGRSDYRDTLTVLADLFVRAKEVGMDPVPHFQAVGEISSTQALHDGDTPLAEMLREFHTYAIVAEWRPMESWARYFLVLIAIIVLILMITYLLG